MQWVGSRILSLVFAGLRIDDKEHVTQFGRVLFLFTLDVFDESARGRIFGAEILDHALVNVDHHALGNEVLANHVGQRFTLNVLRHGTLNEVSGIEIRFAAELLDAFCDSVCMCALLVRVFLKEICDAAAVHSRGHEVVVLITKHADDFGRECFIQYFDDSVLIEFIAVGDCAFFDLLHCALANFLYIFCERSHETSLGSGNHCRPDFRVERSPADAGAPKREVLPNLVAPRQGEDVRLRHPDTEQVKQQLASCLKHQYYSNERSVGFARGGASLIPRGADRTKLSISRYSSFGRKRMRKRATVRGAEGATAMQAAPEDSRFDRRMAELLDHATDVFFERGYEGASMRDLSRASGMSLAGLYHYVDSKERLLYLIQRHAFATILERLHSRL